MSESTPDAMPLFSTMEMLALLSGFDVAQFVCPARLTNSSLSWVLWRKNRAERALVRKYARTGLVDAECTPSPVLAKLLAPLTSPGVYVANGQSPLFYRGESYERTECVYVMPTGDSGTHVTKVSGLFGGWRLRALATRDEVLDAVLSMHRMSSRLRPSAPAEHVIVPDDPDLNWMRQAFNDEPIQLPPTAASSGVNVERLTETGYWWLNFGKPEYEYKQLKAGDALPMVSYSTQDCMGCVLDESGVLASRLPLSGETRVRIAEVCPDVGFSFSVERAGKQGYPDDWWDREELRPGGQFGSYDYFADAKQLAELLLTVDENPNS